MSLLFLTFGQHFDTPYSSIGLDFIFHLLLFLFFVLLLNFPLFQLLHIFVVVLAHNVFNHFFFLLQGQLRLLWGRRHFRNGQSYFVVFRVVFQSFFWTYLDIRSWVWLLYRHSWLNGVI